jgi:large subunit ribosomal protein L16
MLTPKRTRYRKQQKGRIKGTTRRGCFVEFGDYALQAIEPGKITSRQLEASRVALNRHIKRGGKIWIRVFPHKPATKKPAETRMGSGKGSVEHYIEPLRIGRVIFEVVGVSSELAKSALQRAAAKLPFKTQILDRQKQIWKVD